MIRLGPVEPDQRSPEQQRVYNAIAAGPRGNVGAMWSTMIRVPELADRLQHLGEYIRFGTSLPQRLSALAALITARYYDCEYVWLSHAPKAKTFGLADRTIEAIRERRRPEAMLHDECIVYDFTSELLNQGQVTNAVYESSINSFGARGTVELGVIIGYYTMIEMTALAHELAI